MIFQSRHVVIRYITVLSVEAGRDDIMLLSLTQTEHVKKCKYWGEKKFTEEKNVCVCV